MERGIDGPDLPLDGLRPVFKAFGLPEAPDGAVGPKTCCVKAGDVSACPGDDPGLLFEIKSRGQVIETVSEISVKDCFPVRI